MKWGLDKFSGIDGDQIEQVARIIVAGIRAENPIPDWHDPIHEETHRRIHGARKPHRT